MTNPDGSHAHDPLDGRIGEAWSGDVPNGSHINLVIARRGSAAAAAIAGALASPRPGHVPYLACLEPGTLVRPVTVVVNKSTLGDETLNRLTWGAAQVGIAQGVLDAVSEGLFGRADVDSVQLLVALWVDPKAHDERAVKAANRSAMRAAIADALTDHSADEIQTLAGRREHARSPYYRGD
jgi:5,6,7,8-tetrahydromethanopterin hydro-lyase